MTTTQIIGQVLETKTALLVRNRKEEYITGQDWNYDIKPLFTGKKKGWVLLDTFTANALNTVYEALSDKGKNKVNQMHIINFINFTWKCVK